MSVLKTKRNIANTTYCFESRKFYLNFKSRKPSTLRAYSDCKNEIIKLAEKLGLKINKKKTHLKKILQGFQFLKAKFFLIKRWRCKKIFRQSVRKIRIKLRSFKHFIYERKMTLKNVYTFFQL